jgi:hypothetical protein
MFRVTVHNAQPFVTFELEGRLSEPWLDELKQCWNRTLAGNGKLRLRVDLTGLTFADEAAKKCLADMRRQGAEFVAPDCFTKDIVAQIQDLSLQSDGNGKTILGGET